MTEQPTINQINNYQSNVSPSRDQSPMNEKSNKTLITILPLILVFLLAGVGVFAYFYFFQPSGRIVQKMITNFKNIKTLEYSGEIEAKIPESSNSSNYLNYLISFTGASEIEKTNNPQARFSFEISDISSPEKKIILASEFRTINKTIYFIFRELPSLKSLPFNLNLEPFKNQWIKIETQDLEKQTEDLTQSFGLTLDPEKINKRKEQLKKLKPQIQNQLQEAPIFKINQKLGKETIEGIETFHYRFLIDKKEIKNLISELNKMIEKETEEEMFTQEEIEKINQILQMINFKESEIWLGKKDYLPYKIHLIITTNNKNQKKEKPEASFSLTLFFKNFNQPLQMEVPSGSVKTLEEILKELWSQFFGGLFQTPLNQFSPSSNNQRTFKDTDNDGLSDEMEFVYGSDPNNPDTDGDGYKDGEEVKNGYNPIGPGKLNEWAGEIIDESNSQNR
jgi:hypothetical protein